MLNFLKTVSFVCFEGEIDPEVDPQGDPQGDPKGPETFTQEQVNTFIADEKRKMQTKQREMATELKTLKSNSALSTDEKDTLQARIDELKSQYQSKDERAKEDSDKKQKEYDTALTGMTEERNQWASKHSDLLIRTEITKSAADNKAISVEQISAILGPKTELVEDLDDEGSPQGSFSPRVKFPDVNKEGNEIELILTVNEAVQRMKKIERYGNLFEGDKKGGAGGIGSSSGGTGKTDLAKLAADPDQTGYREARKKNRTVSA